MNKPERHPDAGLIAIMGGPTAAARFLGVSQQRVQNWLTRGIPAKVRLDNSALFKRLERKALKRKESGK